MASGLMNMLHTTLQIPDFRRIHDRFKVSDTDGTALDFSDLLKIELKTTTLQSSHTKCDKTIIAMREYPDQ